MVWFCLFRNPESQRYPFGGNEISLDFILKEESFLEKLNLLGEERLFFLTGANMLDRYRLKMLNSLANVLGAKIITYLIDESLIGEGGWVDDVLILPKYFSKHGKVEILIPNLETE